MYFGIFLSKRASLTVDTCTTSFSSFRQRDKYYPERLIIVKNRAQGCIDLVDVIVLILLYVLFDNPLNLLLNLHTMVQEQLIAKIHAENGKHLCLTKAGRWLTNSHLARTILCQKN